MAIMPVIYWISSMNYECDSVDVTYTLAKLNLSQTMELANGSAVTPYQVPYIYEPALETCRSRQTCGHI